MGLNDTSLRYYLDISAKVFGNAKHLISSFVSILCIS